MLANAITVTRLLLTFGVIILFGIHRKIDIALITTIALVFTLDAFDGYIARKRNETSETGALLDTLADRIIENTFWIYFTGIGLIPIWMPITVMTRGVLTDTLQKSFGYPQNGWTHVLSRGRISRAFYGFIKMLTFMSLASTLVFKTPVIETASANLTIFTVVFCLLRGLPFFFLRKTSCRKST